MTPRSGRRLGAALKRLGVVPRRPATTQEEARDGFVAVVRAALGEGSASVVAVVADASTRGQAAVDEARAELRGVRVVVIDAKAPLRAQHLKLTADGPFDAIVDLAPGPRFDRFTRFFFHLTRGGTYVLPAADRTKRRLESLFQEAAATPGSTPQRAVPRHDALRVHGELEGDRSGSGFLTVRSDVSALATVRDHEMADLLAEDPSRGTVLSVRPAREWQVRCQVRTSRPMPLNPLPTHYDAPALYVREYADAVVMPRQVALGRNVVLPESFTTVENHRQRNSSLRNLGTDFVVSPEVEDEPPRLNGVYFHLDNPMIHHFGHVLSEQLSHLWGWPEAKARHPSLRALVFTDSGDLAPWQQSLLVAGGVAEDDIVVLQRPHRVERLVGCTPMFSRPAFAHPDLVEVYDQVSSSLTALAPARETPQRLFLSRRSTKRACRNADEVHAAFRAAGFEIVYPEDHPLPEQVRLVRQAEVIAGFAGSQMFHIAFAGGPKHVVLICSEAYPAHNEYMMSAVVGHQVDIAVCTPSVPRKPDEFTREAFHSDYSFDFTREGPFLQQVFEQLP